MQHIKIFGYTSLYHKYIVTSARVGWFTRKCSNSIYFSNIFAGKEKNIVSKSLLLSISAVHVITCNKIVLYIIRVIKTDTFPNQYSNLSFFHIKLLFLVIYIIITRIIIRYQVAAILRQPQIKQGTASNKGEGLPNQREHHIIFR